MTFSEIGLSPEILSAISDLGYTQPTPIQESAIPVILSKDHDLIALAQTGTGKTAAFGLPIIAQIDYENRNLQALILAPTRELCVQITKDLESFGSYCRGLKITAVYGGASIEGQIRQLQRGPHIVVGTPGRTLDMIRRGVLKVEAIRWVVLDEADEMLKMGFQEDMDAILAATPDTRQTLLFSATMPHEIVGMTRRYMKNPQEISVGQKNTGSVNVEHWYYVVHPKDKYLALKRIADMHPGIYGIIFCKTRIETQEIASALIEDNYNADALHGDLSQAQRDHVMGRFRSGHLQMLVATDVAARGLDVDDLTHVINYRLPDHLDSYIHRSGRTGRAGKKGVAISILGPRDRRYLRTLEHQVGKQFIQKRIPSGSEIMQQQLVSYVSRIEATEFDPERMASFMEPIFEKLSYLSREDLIQKFVAMEFSRLLNYYQRAGDLNADSAFQERPERREREPRREEYREREPRQREEYRDREPRQREQQREPENRRERRDRERATAQPEITAGGNVEQGGAIGDNRAPSRGYTRFFVNVGTKNQLTPSKLISIINSNDHLSSAQIGKIEIMKKFSFFELDNSHADSAADQISGLDYDGTRLHCERAEAPKAPIEIKEKAFSKRKEGGSSYFGGMGAKRQGGGFASKRAPRTSGGDGFWGKSSYGSSKPAGKVKAAKATVAAKPKRSKGSADGWD